MGNLAIPYRKSLNFPEAIMDHADPPPLFISALLLQTKKIFFRRSVGFLPITKKTFFFPVLVP